MRSISARMVFTLLSICLIISSAESSNIHRRIERRPTKAATNKWKPNNDAQQQQKQQNLEAEMEMNRTLSKIIETDGDGVEQNRFVLLICKTKCSRERTEIASWVRKFSAHQIQQQNLQQQQATGHNQGSGSNQSAIDGDQQQQEAPLGFHYHFYRRPFPLADIERAINRRRNTAVASNNTISQQTNAILFYVVLGRAFPADEGIGRKEEFMHWLDGFENKKIQVLEEANEMNAWLNSQCHVQLAEAGQALALRRLEHELVFLAVHDPEICLERQFKNMARFFSNWENVLLLKMHRPLSEDVDFQLHWRLPRLTNACQMLIVLQGDNYVELTNGISGREMQEIEKNLTASSRKSSGISSSAHNINCSNTTMAKGILPGMRKILAPLTPIELEYWQQERHLKAIEYNRQYITVGTIGGVAVIALAMSIFWGLNGNDFVPKQ